MLYQKKLHAGLSLSWNAGLMKSNLAKGFIARSIFTRNDISRYFLLAQPD
jgi:hypothetical protein